MNIHSNRSKFWRLDRLEPATFGPFRQASGMWRRRIPVYIFRYQNLQRLEPVTLGLWAYLLFPESGFQYTFFNIRIWTLLSGTGLTLKPGGFSSFFSRKLNKLRWPSWLRRWTEDPMGLNSLVGSNPARSGIF